MAIKKNELSSSLWASCDELRGGMDASQYKDYVLTLLFVKYVSDKAKGNPYAMIDVPEGAQRYECDMHTKTPFKQQNSHAGSAGRCPHGCGENR